MEVLVSINSLEEATLVLSAGVKWVDLKDTSHGALASLSKDLSAQIVTYIQDQIKASQLNVTISATVGDTFANINDFIAQLKQKLDLNIDVIKVPYQAITLFDDIEALRPILAQTSQQSSRVIVVFTPQNYLALSGRLEPCLKKLASVGVFGVMLDTDDKSKDLFASLEIRDIQVFIAAAKKHGFFLGLAGGLQIQSIENLFKLSPDIVGFRSAVSADHNRKQTITPHLLHLLIKNCVINTN